MITDHLFEEWNIDAGILEAAAKNVFGECDVYLGGSCSDDLAGRNSDIDLYCFTPRSQNELRAQAIGFGDVLVEFHPISQVDYVNYNHSLHPLLSAPKPPEGLNIPLPTTSDLRCMHALWRDRAIRRGPYSESGRRSTGADILHLYVSLRSIVTASNLLKDASCLVEDGDFWAALYCVRLCAESMSDAVMASVGYYNPNAKWRVSLLQRAFQDVRLSREDPRPLLEALFPNPTPDLSFSVCVCAIETSLGILQRDLTLVHARSAIEDLCIVLDAAKKVEFGRATKA